MTIEDILNLGDEEISKLNQKELGKIVRDLGKVVNSRIARLEKARGGIAEDALRSITKSGGKIHSAGLNRNQLIKELYRGSHFARLETSTVSGARKVGINRIKTALGGTPEELGLTFQEASKLTGNFYDFYYWFADYAKSRGLTYTEDEARAIWDESGGDMEKAREEAAKILTGRYEEKEQAEQEAERWYWERVEEMDIDEMTKYYEGI